jgi:hypothetical protein
MDTLEIVCFLPGMPNSSIPTSTYTRLAKSEKALKDMPFRRSTRTNGRKSRVITDTNVWAVLTLETIFGKLFPNIDQVKS